MTGYSTIARLAMANALSLGLLLAGSITRAADAPAASQSSAPSPAPTYGPGMMYNMTPEQQQQHWEQMQQHGNGPGGMGNGPGGMGNGPGSMGQGPGAMMGAPAGTPPAATKK